MGDEKPLPYKDRVSEENRTLHTQLITSSWCGLLAALTPLIDAATDESVTENVLKAMQNYAALCGLLELHTARDAFITAICKSSLPPHYALSVLNMGYQMAGIKMHTRTNSQDLGSQYISQCGENDFRHQVVAVGTPLPSLPIGNSNAFFFLSFFWLDKFPFYKIFYDISRFAARSGDAYSQEFALYANAVTFSTLSW